MDTAYTVVAPSEEQHFDLSPSDLRAILQKADDETKLHTLRRIIVSTLNGQPQLQTKPHYNRFSPCSKEK